MKTSAAAAAAAVIKLRIRYHVGWPAIRVAMVRAEDACRRRRRAPRQHWPVASGRRETRVAPGTPEGRDGAWLRRRRRRRARARRPASSPSPGAVGRGREPPPPCTWSIIVRARYGGVQLAAVTRGRARRTRPSSRRPCRAMGIREGIRYPSLRSRKRSLSSLLAAASLPSDRPHRPPTPPKRAPPDDVIKKNKYIYIHTYFFFFNSPHSSFPPITPSRPAQRHVIR